MLSFTCDNCSSLLFFENTTCLHCGLGQGYLPAELRLAAIADTAAGAVRLVDGPTDLVRCRNADEVGCNWLVAAPSAGERAPWCRSCRLTRTRPSRQDAEGVAAWVRAEAAKRRLVFQLDDLRLPVPAMVDGADGGLTFDLLSSRDEPVTTGHDDGIVTIDMAEGIDSHREKVRAQLAEPYRTLLGHFRHETGHFYEWLLVERPGDQDRLRPVFGDESIDYAEQIERHYRDGPPADWRDYYVSSYATMHPYEDFAETFAHYLHIRDTLQTADDFGIGVTGPRRAGVGAYQAVGHDDPAVPFAALLEDWVPLTLALNAVNRSMGQEDLYPFALAPAVAAKLDAVHLLLRSARLP